MEEDSTGVYGVGGFNNQCPEYFQWADEASLVYDSDWVTHRLLLPDWVESVELVSLVGMRTMPVSTRTEAEGLRMVNMPEVEDMWRSGSVARTSVGKVTPDIEYVKSGVWEIPGTYEFELTNPVTGECRRWCTRRPCRSPQQE